MGYSRPWFYKLLHRYLEESTDWFAERVLRMDLQQLLPRLFGVAVLPGRFQARRVAAQRLDLVQHLTRFSEDHLCLVTVGLVAG